MQEAPPSRVSSEDEIDLVDLFLVVWRRKLLLLLVTLASFLTGVAYVSLRTPSYNYVTSFEVGSLLKGDGTQGNKVSVEPIESVKIKLEEVYIPQAIRQIASTYQQLPTLKATVRTHQNSDILLIESKGHEDMQHLYGELHHAIISPVVDQHDEIVSAAQEEYLLGVKKAEVELQILNDPDIYLFSEQVLLGEIEQAKAALSGLNDKKKLLESQKKRLVTMQEILKQQIVQVKKNLQSAYERLPGAATQADDEPKALTFLMLNSQIEQNERRLADLQERLQVKTEDDKQVLENQLLENQRSQDLQKNKVAELQSKLTKLRAERKSNIEQQQNAIDDAKSKIALYRKSNVIGLAQQSLSAEGPGKLIVLMLSCLIGLMGGVFLAFGAEFMGRVRRQQAGS